MKSITNEWKAVILAGGSIFIFILGFLLLPSLPKAEPAGLKNDPLHQDDDVLVMAVDAPDVILTYRPGSAKPPIPHPSDERLNDMKLDKEGERVFVVTKDGWLNIFEPLKLKARIRHKIGDVLQCVALSGNEQFAAVGLGNEADYNAREVGIYRVAELENRHGDPQPIATIPLKGDIQGIVGNPDPENNRGYIMSSQDDKLTVFDFASGNRLGYIEIGNSMAAFKCKPDGTKGYASINARRSIAVIDLRKDHQRTVKHIEVPSAPYYLAFNADGSHLYVGSRDKAEVYLIDTKTDELIQVLTLISPVASLHMTAELTAVSSDENYLYVMSKYGLLFTFDLTNEDGDNTLDVVQQRAFPKAPALMDVIRPKK